MPDPRARQEQKLREVQARKNAAQENEDEHRVERPLPSEGLNLGDKYEFVKFLGGGSYGDVFEAKEKRSGRRVAVKHIYNIFEDAANCAFCASCSTSIWSSWWTSFRPTTSSTSRSCTLLYSLSCTLSINVLHILCTLLAVCLWRAPKRCTFVCLRS